MSTSSTSDPRGQQVDLETLTPQQLVQVKKQLEEEIALLTQNFGALKVAHTRFIQSLESLEDVSKSEEDQEMLVPLTSSVYVKGKLTSNEKVLVDLGTGFYAEKDIKSAAIFIKGKCVYIQKNVEQVAQTIVAKRKSLEMVTVFLNARVAAMQEQEMAKTQTIQA